MLQDSKYNLFQTHDTLFYFYTRTNASRYSTFDLSYIFYYQTYFHICMIYVIDLFIPVIILKNASLNLLFHLEHILY